ncbi:MAG TPA: TRAP transporter large permease subunit, partial [Burkholderiaceae bacterium]|nr:TRAP transporter large permease subunit [Burkholderiaceae bacterium]
MVKIRKELWFGFSLMGLILLGIGIVLLRAETITYGHYGLLMLALIVVAIMLGFPTAFTLMGMGMIFTWIAYNRDTTKTLDLMVQAAFKVMSNDVLISIPLFVFMGYLVERANLIDRLFHSLHLALARIPGSLAVATLFTCAVFATATGIVGAVVTLMGLLAFPQMLKAGYDVKLSAGAVTAGGCLGILIPPSVMLIVYGATAGVSVVQLYAGAFFPGLMLAGLYIVYVILLAKLKPSLAPPLSVDARRVDLPAPLQRLQAASKLALPGLLRGVGNDKSLRTQLFAALLPALGVLVFAILAWRIDTTPVAVNVAAANAGGALQEPAGALREPPGSRGGLQEPPGGGGLREPSGSGLQEPPGSSTLKEPPGAGGDAASAPAAATALAEPAGAQGAAAGTTAPTVQQPPSASYWIGLGVGALLLVAFYALLTFERFQIFKMLLASFFPLVMLILAVLGSIVFGLATPTEAAAVGAFGGYLLAAVYAVIAKRNDKTRVFAAWLLLWAPALVAIGWFALNLDGVIKEPVSQAFGAFGLLCVLVWTALAYRQSGLGEQVSESVKLTAKTSAMVCWLFVGSAIFSAAFALLGGQELVEKWVLSMNLSKVQFMLLSQFIIFVLGWPLEWTEIIVIFMPIFIPLLDKFGVDPLFFGLLVALNLQTAFLSPPVA